MSSEEYAEYLKTPHWRFVRRAVFWSRARACQVCGGKRGLVVHHNNYRHLRREKPEDLVILCHVCHALFHGKDKQTEKNVLLDGPLMKRRQEICAALVGATDPEQVRELLSEKMYLDEEIEQHGTTELHPGA